MLVHPQTPAMWIPVRETGAAAGGGRDAAGQAQGLGSHPASHCPLQQPRCVVHSGAHSPPHPNRVWVVATPSSSIMGHPKPQVCAGASGAGVVACNAGRREREREREKGCESKNTHSKESKLGGLIHGGAVPKMGDRQLHKPKGGPPTGGSYISSRNGRHGGMAQGLHL